MKAQIAPPKVAVEARPCAWAGRARSCGGRRRTAGPVGRTAPPSGRALRAGPPGGRGGRGRGAAKSTKSRSGAPRFWAATFYDRDAVLPLPTYTHTYTSVGPAALPASVVRAVRDAGSALEVGSTPHLHFGFGCRRSSMQALLKISLSQALISQSRQSNPRRRGHERLIP